MLNVPPTGAGLSIMDFNLCEYVRMRSFLFYLLCVV